MTRPDSVNSRYANLPCSPYLSVNRTQAEVAAGVTREAKAAHLRLVETAGAREEEPMPLHHGGVDWGAFVGTGACVALFWAIVLYLIF